MSAPRGSTPTLSIFDAARAAPDALALVAGDGKLTFAELAARVERRRFELAQAGLLSEESQPVAVVAKPALSSVETLLALFSAGTAALLLHPRSSEAERAELVRRAGARLESDSTAPGAIPAQSVDPERIAAIVPTSGTTGAPRLARLSHRALLAAAEASAAHLGVEADRWLVTLPLAHVGGLMILVRSLVARTAVVLFEPDGPLLSRLDALAATLRESDVTLLSLVPTVLDRLLAPPHDWHPPPSLRAVLVGGAACPSALLERAHARNVPVLTTYGLTETAAQVATRRYTARFDPPEPLGPLVPAGVPLLDVEVRVIDGVIEVRGPSLFSGYVGEPASDPARDWFRTHDRGFFTPSGELAISGRTSDLIITGGENVDPVEVEAALLSLPDIVAACVIGVPEPTFGEVVAAIVVATNACTLEELTTALRPRLAPFKLPRKLVVVPELPALPSGKLDRRAARLRYATRFS